MMLVHRLKPLKLLSKVIINQTVQAVVLIFFVTVQVLAAADILLGQILISEYCCKNIINADIVL